MWPATPPTAAPLRQPLASAGTLMAEIASSTAAQDKNAFIFLTPFVAVSIRGFRFRSLLRHQHTTRWPRRDAMAGIEWWSILNRRLLPRRVHRMSLPQTHYFDANLASV